MNKLIAKEQISQVRFVEAPKSSDEKNLLHKDLEKAAVLGNAFRNKVSITFETVEGTLTVITTVWAALQEGVSLKGGVFIPVRAIRGINLV